MLDSAIKASTDFFYYITYTYPGRENRLGGFGVPEINIPL